MKEKKPLSIGEVAKIIGVEIHTIRFWTEEFSEYISFTIGKGDRRYYDEKAIKMLEKIKKLLHDDGIRIKIIKEKKLLIADPTPEESLNKDKLSKVVKLLSEAKELLIFR